MFDNQTLLKQEQIFIVNFFEIKGKISLQNCDYPTAENALRECFINSNRISNEKQEEIGKLYAIANILSSNKQSCFDKIENFAIEVEEKNRLNSHNSAADI